MHGIRKILVSGVLNTYKVSSNIVAMLNLDIANIYKSNSFYSIDINNMLMTFLYRDGLHLSHTGKELLERIFIVM